MLFALICSILYFLASNILYEIHNYCSLLCHWFQGWIYKCAWSETPHQSPLVSKQSFLGYVSLVRFSSALTFSPWYSKQQFPATFSAHLAVSDRHQTRRGLAQLPDGADVITPAASEPLSQVCHHTAAICPQVNCPADGTECHTMQNGFLRFLPVCMLHKLCRLDLCYETMEEVTRRLLHGTARLEDAANFIYHIPGCEAHGGFTSTTPLFCRY